MGMVRLGQMLPGWADVAQQQEAIRWFRCAAELGSPEGMFGVGGGLVTGMGGPCDVREGEIWLRKEAGAEHVSAMEMLGQTLAEKHPNEAMSWWRKAATRGAGPSMFLLGHGLCTGFGGRVDPVESVVWLRKAASLGVEGAAPLLRVLENSPGV